MSSTRSTPCRPADADCSGSSNTDETVTLEVVTDPKKQTTTQRDLAFADITKALVQVEFVSAKKDKTQEGEG